MLLELILDNERCAQFFTAFALSLGTMMIGVITSWHIPIHLKYADNLVDIRISDSDSLWMFILPTPAFLVGSIITWFTSDRLGRKSSILFSALPYISGTLFAAFAFKGWMFCVMYFLWSMGTGMISTVTSMYLAEIADKEIRGSLAATTVFMVSLGSLLTMGIGPHMSYKTMNYCIMLLPIFFFVFCTCIPESPYYYLKTGKEDQAKEVLLRRRKNLVEAEAELELMKADVKKEMSRPSTLLELLRGSFGQYRSAVIISLGLKISEVFLSTTTLNQHLSRIILLSNITVESTDVFIYLESLKLVVGIISSILADRVGRRSLLITSFIGNSMSLLIVALYFLVVEVLLVNENIVMPYSWIPIAGIVASIVVSTLGFKAIIQMVQAEIFPLNVKAVAMTLLYMLDVSLRFGISYAYTSIKQDIGAHGVFWVFVAVSICAALFTFFVVPETKGKSLREIQNSLQGAKNTTEITELNDVHSHVEANTSVGLVSKQQKGLYI